MKTMNRPTAKDLERAMQVAAKLQSADLHVQDRDAALNRAAWNYSVDRSAHHSSVAMEIEEQWITAKAALVKAQNDFRMVATELTNRTGQSMEAILALALEEVSAQGTA